MDAQIKRKLRGYKAQDEKFEIYSEAHTIRASDVREMLDASKGLCTHCAEPMLTEYAARDMRQWTVDRIDNRMGHNKGNVVVCCLKCNLKRRNIAMDKFRFTKQLSVVKLDSSISSR